MSTRLFVVAVLALVASCSSAPGYELVCDDFAAHAKAGLPRSERGQVVTSISEIISEADQPLQDAFEVLARTVDGPDSAYQLGADTFAQACFDAGWDG